MVRLREEVAKEDCWNVESLFKDPSEWRQAFKAFVNLDKKPYWPEIDSFKGTLGKGPQQLKEAIECLLKLERELTKLYVYAHLRHDEDITQAEFKANYDEVTTCAHLLSQETTWFQPELMSLSDDLLNEYVHSSILKDYHFYLERMIRMKKHTLSAESEALMAMADQAMQVAHNSFRAINDADFQFGSVVDSQGDEKPITHGLYGLYIRDQDRVLRERAFKKYHGQYMAYENTLCELLTGQVQNHAFHAKARHYPSCLEAALFPKNIDTSVYHSLLQAVNEKIDVLHRYMALRKRVLNVNELHLYDVYVPLTKDIEIQMSYCEAEDIVVEAVAPLGSEYQNFLRKGFKEQRWVDRYENKNKRSGAYSSGCYDSVPFILMNYKNILRDVYTLAHEAGHSMHSLYSHHTQPYHYSDYPIFLAEVASTFNENLLVKLLLERCTDPMEKIFLINQQIEDIRGTLFRQTMFAEFELMIHEKIEQNIPITPQLLKSEYRKLNQKYFGPAVIIDEEIDIEWARIPHFYANFYVFQYATGISAALALSDRVLQGGQKERDEYLGFLKSGSSKYPIETLKTAGIDMSSPQPVKAAIHKFDLLITELENLLTNNKI